LSDPAKLRSLIRSLIHCTYHHKSVEIWPALADQAAGTPHGFANPLFYSLAGSSAYTDIVSPGSTVAVVRTNFNNGVDASDGLSYVLRTMNQTLSLKTTPGWDDVTGLGTPTSSFLSSVG
jgi:hypothetical protein